MLRALVDQVICASDLTYVTVILFLNELLSLSNDKSTAFVVYTVYSITLYYIVDILGSAKTESLFSDNGIIKSERVVTAMKAVDRGNFCKHNPYLDAPQSIGYQVTISAPHMVSRCFM